MILLTLFLAACSFVLCILLTPLLRNFALRFHYVDEPDFERKSHAVPVPRIGGIPVVLAHAASIGALLLIVDGENTASRLHISLLRAMLPAGALVFFIGLLDDLFGLKPSQKLAGQIVAAALGCWAGLYREGAEGLFAGNVWGLMAIVIWLVGCSNSFNLIDGADGVASGIGVFGALTMAAAGIVYGDPGLVLAMAPLAGALLGFLRFNFHPASIFLGDCGSLWIGFVLGGYGVIWSQQSSTFLGAFAPVMALSIPLLDMTLAVARRFISGEGHFHRRCRPYSSPSAQSRSDRAPGRASPLCGQRSRGAVFPAPDRVRQQCGRDCRHLVLRRRLHRNQICPLPGIRHCGAPVI